MSRFTPAPSATRCEAHNNSCGAGQPLYDTGGLIHCEHHGDWPNSPEGKRALAIKKIDNGEK